MPTHQQETYPHANHWVMKGDDYGTLIRSLRNPDPEVVIAALATLRNQGGLTTGALQGVQLQHALFSGMNFREADLQRADLQFVQFQHADLSQADLRYARLFRADLFGANLQGTLLEGASMLQVNLQATGNINEKQLSSARCLWGSIMPDGDLYDGRYQLSGDRFAAVIRGINPYDSLAMADFFAGAEFIQEQDIPSDLAFPSLNTAKLIRMLRAQDPRIVSRALEELRQRGCLEDGSLAWAYLRYVQMEDTDLHGVDLNHADLSMANLRRVNLSQACLCETQLLRINMYEANLVGAHLEGASLSFAILQGAKGLTEEQLQSTSRLRGAILPDGARYDGCFHLVGDLLDASYADKDLNDPRSRADFYGVAPEHDRNARSVTDEESTMEIQDP